MNQIGYENNNESMETSHYQQFKKYANPGKNFDNQISHEEKQEYYQEHK